MNSILIDTHIHTNHSHDGVSPMREYVIKAIEAGAKVIGFTEHFDRDCIPYNLPNVQLDEGSYITESLKLCEEFDGKLKILIGLEIGFDKGFAEEEALKAAEKFEYDYFINSVHLVDGIDPYYPEFYENRSKEFVYDEYVESVLASIDANFPYNVVGHIGYITKYATYADSSLNYGDYKLVFDEIFKKMIRREVALEVNTSTGKTGDLFRPNGEIIQKYLDAGGKLISFGADAHKTDRLFDKFAETTAYLKGLGVKELVYYEKRNPRFVKL